MKQYKNLTWEKRLKIEALYTADVPVKDIAKQLGVHNSTIYRELKRGKAVKRNTDWTEKEIYSPDLAQKNAEENQKQKGRHLKIGNDLKYVQFIEDMIIRNKYSPQAVLAHIQRENLEFDTKICLTTLYNYIKKGIFLHITMEDCPYRKQKPKRKKRKVQKRLSAGTSIEERPKDIIDRDEIGHWEMDTVVGGQGKSKKSLLVLTERKTRNEIVELLNTHTAAEVVRTLDRLERKYGEKCFREKFKTITVDNGTEFSDWEGMERSRRNKHIPRTKIYYCHPYRSCERGSNENQNKLIRRWYPKGCCFDYVTKGEIKRMEKWINTYPRLLFQFKTSEEMLALDRGT